MLKQDLYSIFTDSPQALPEGMITASGLDERFLSKRCRVLWFTARDKSTKANSANTANENNKKNKFHCNFIRPFIKKQRLYLTCTPEWNENIWNWCSWSTSSDSSKNMVWTCSNLEIKSKPEVLFWDFRLLPFRVFQFQMHVFKQQTQGIEYFNFIALFNPID